VNLYGPIGEWIVDYAQLFGTRRRFTNREQEMAYVSHTLQALVRELGGVWLIGCQFNEAGLVEMRTPKHDDKGRLIHRLPQRGDLRESQAFFHDSDRTLGLYRPPEDCRGQEQTSSNILNPEMWIVQMKRRRGGEGFVRCWFQKRFTRFVELGELDASERQTAPDQKAYLAKKQPRPSPPAVEKPETF
jgi:replicative DNA helicase